MFFSVGLRLRALAPCLKICIGRQRDRKPLDGNKYHLITCKYSGGPARTYNTIVQTWSECLSQLHVVHKIEPKHCFLDCDSRPDIYVVDPDSGK